MSLASHLRAPCSPLAQCLLVLLLLLLGCPSGKEDASPDSEPAEEDPGLDSSASDTESLSASSQKPLDVLVRVQNELGRALSQARVTLDGRGEISDERGDARFERVVQREGAVTVSRDGAVSYSAPLDAGSSVLQRVLATLAPWEGVERLVSGEFAEIGGEGWHLSLGPEALYELVEPGASGSYQLRWRWDGREGLTRTTSSLVGPPVGQDEGGELRGLVPVAQLSFDLLGDAGRPLQISESAPARLRARWSEAGRGCVEPPSLWRMDRVTGYFIEVPDAVLEHWAARDGCWIELALPASGSYLLARSERPRCFTPVILGVDPMWSPTELSVEGPGIAQRRALTGAGRGARWEDLPPLPLELTLLVNGVALARRTVTPGYACEDVTLQADSDEGVAVSLSSAAGCPASGTRVTLETLDGEVLEDERWDSPLRTLRVPAHEPILARTWDEHGQALDKVVLSRPGPLAATLFAPAEHALDVPGGCHQPVCSDGSCDACTVIEALGLGDDATVEDELGLAEDVGGAILEIDPGTVCLDVDDGAELELPFTIAGGPPRSVQLRGGTSCADTRGCVWRTVHVDPTPVCNPDEEVLQVESRELAWLDPAWNQGVSSAWPGATASGELILEASSDLPSGSDTLRCDGGAYALLEQEHDEYGLERGGPTRVHCETADGTEVTLALDLRGGSVVDGEVPLASVTGGQPGQILLQSPEGEASLRLNLESGWLRVHERSDTWLSLELRAEIDSSIWSDETEVSIRLSVPMISRADTPRHLDALAERNRAPAWIRVVAREEPSLANFGSGDLGGVPSANPPIYENDPVVIVPTRTPFEFFGEAGRGYLSAVSPRMSLTEDLHIDGNHSSASALLARLPLRWVHKDVVARLYSVNAREASLMEEGATIFGRLLRASSDGASLEPIEDAGAVYLSSPGGGRIEGRRVGDDLRFTEDSRRSTFAFLAVPPNPPEAPYTLVVEDAHGDIIPDMTMQIVLSPGSALVLMP